MVVTLSEYQSVRDETERLAAPLSPEDQQVQSMPDVSPTKWHRAHITWFFETFLLLRHLPGYEPFDAEYQYLYNSYYEAVGDRHAREERGLISRPTASKVAEYRRHVDEAMVRFIDEVVPDDDELEALTLLGLHHEQQHQELLLMDIKHVLSRNPTRPKYHEIEPSEPTSAEPLGWQTFDGGLLEIGNDSDDFYFDNEGPRHQTFVAPFSLADRLVTNGDWLDFMADDGYHEAGHWLSAGWATVTNEGWEAPLYWETTAHGWHVHTLHGFVPVDRDEPVCHVSYFEADAFARWADARLPTEAEWEHAASTVSAEVTAETFGRFHPSTAPEPNGEPRQMFGELWQWTSSAYNAYPGFRPTAGAVGEYNGKFMVNQYVLRGSCCATPLGHTRPTYRNFFPAHSRWMFSGLRLATDI
ncbi:MAG: ergothioneine biosynthesis protein EgtB [Verrucomicrobiales bacterium]|jgi:ergothioneine biosynthesis protein EgtB